MLITISKIILILLQDMTELEIKIKVKVFKHMHELKSADEALMQAAKRALSNCYAPYSGFKVSAAVLLANGEILTGTNQENASFPVGICAEGTVLSAVSAVYPGVAIKKMAITVRNMKQLINYPVSPCGICRQRILEYETRFESDIEIIMMGEEGEVYSVSSIRDLLPLQFSKADLSGN
jgi:cytidine deaminase